MRSLYLSTTFNVAMECNEILDHVTRPYVPIVFLENALLRFKISSILKRNKSERLDFVESIESVFSLSPRLRNNELSFISFLSQSEIRDPEP